MDWPEQTNTFRRSWWLNVKGIWFLWFLDKKHQKTWKDIYIYIKVLTRSMIITAPISQTFQLWLITLQQANSLKNLQGHFVESRSFQSEVVLELLNACLIWWLDDQPADETCGAPNSATSSSTMSCKEIMPCQSILEFWLAEQEDTGQSFVFSHHFMTSEKWCENGLWCAANTSQSPPMTARLQQSAWPPEFE